MLQDQFKPPEWVIINYWTQYSLLTIVWNKKDEQGRSTLPSAEDGVTNSWWTNALRIMPKLDMWISIEKKLYGRVVTKEVQDYYAYNENRILLYPPKTV